MTASQPTFRHVDAASALWRVRYTPLSDLLRGELSARLSVAYAIDQANLPSVISQSIMNIVRRTRLWHRERLDVAKELILHFQDGLDRGLTADAMVRDFGDFMQAAKLIRRAKKRQRPLWWRTSVRSIQAIALLILVCVVVYTGLAIRFFAGTPTISHDYLADLNRTAASVPDSDRAWPIYREALIGMPSVLRIGLDADPQDRPHPSGVKPGDPYWDEYKQFLVANADRLEKIRNAAAMPGLGYVAGVETSEEDRELWPEPPPEMRATPPAVPLMQVLLNHLSSMRTMAHMLALDFRSAVADGDRELALANLEAMLGIAQQSRETPTLIADLVSLAIFQMTFDRVGELLADHASLLSDADLQRLAHRIAAIDNEVLRVRVGNERRWFNDVIQHSYTDDGNGGGRLTPQGLELWEDISGMKGKQEWIDSASIWAASPALGAIVMDRDEAIAEFDRQLSVYEREGNRPLWERTRWIYEQIESSEIESVSQLPIALLLPALDKSTQQQHFVRFGRDVVLTAIALELHRRKRGEWPQTLNELTPQYLPKVPRDIFDGEPLRCKISDGSPLIYSAGNDRDDDGGRPPMWVFEAGTRTDNAAARRWFPRGDVKGYRPVTKEHGTASGFPPDGDWIIWPPFEEQTILDGDRAN